MTEKILMEEFHLTMLVPKDLPPAENERIYRTLNSRWFRSECKRAFRAIVRRQPILRKVTIVLST